MDVVEEDGHTHPFRVQMEAAEMTLDKEKHRAILIELIGMAKCPATSEAYLEVGDLLLSLEKATVAEGNGAARSGGSGVRKKRGAAPS